MKFNVSDKRLTLREANTLVEGLTPGETRCFLGGPDAYMKTVYTEAHNHLVVPVIKFAMERIKAEESNGKLNVMTAPPGCGKTHTFCYDLLWRIFSEMMKYRKDPNMIIVFTSPDTAVNQEVLENINMVINWAKRDSVVRNKIFNTWNLDLSSAVDHPSKLAGTGSEILVCTPKMIAEDGPGKDVFELRCNESFLAAIVSDEAHRGLGCPSSERYHTDVGWLTQTYNATWFHGLRNHNAFLWIGLTGTPTMSQKSDDKFYNVISDGMTKSSWKNGFVDVLDSGDYTMKEIVEKVFFDITETNTINKHMFSLLSVADINKEILEVYETYLKQTAMFRCGMNGANGNSSKWGTAEDVQIYWDKLSKKYYGKEFTYVQPWDKKKVTLIMLPGKCAICLHENKSAEDNKGVFELMNSPHSGYDALAVFQIGTVGVNIKNLRYIGIIPKVSNLGEVENSPVQLLGRLARCPFVWPGNAWSIPVSQIKNHELKEIAIHLAINITTKKVTARTSSLIESAYVIFLKGHVELKGAYTYLSELVNDAQRRLLAYENAKERDEFYRQFKKEHCEIHPEGISNSGIPVCEQNEKELHSDLSDEEFSNYWKGCLEVDHEDADHDNNDPSNLITKCSNNHHFKTMINEDYKTRYPLLKKD